MKKWFVAGVLCLSSCTQNEAPKWEVLDISLAFGCYKNDLMPEIVINSEGMVIPEIGFKYKSIELTRGKDDLLWLERTPAFGIVEQKNGEYKFDYWYEKQELRDAGLNTKFSIRNGVKYLTTASYPDGKSFVYASTGCNENE